MRLFIAITLPPEVREHLRKVQERIAVVAPKVAFTKPENLHLTLKFLGEVSQDVTEKLIESLARITPEPTSLQADGFDCLPTGGPVRIIAARLGGDVARLAALYGAIDQRCQYLGFDSEKRAFRPHVTIARSRAGLSPTAKMTLAKECASCWPAPRFIAQGFSLIRSTLKPSGSEYQVVRNFS